MLINILILFLCIHVIPVIMWFFFADGFEKLLVWNNLEAINEETDMHIDSLRTLCLWSQCEVLDYTQAHKWFRSHAAMIGSSEWFYEKISALDHGVHPVWALIWMADQQEEIRKWRTESMNLFADLSVAEDDKIADWSSHNQVIIQKLLESSNQESDPANNDKDWDNDEENEWADNENERNELSDSEREQLDEYADYLQQQQERYQNEFNQSWEKKPTDLGGIADLLFGDGGVDYGSGVKDR